MKFKLLLADGTTVHGGVRSGFELSSPLVSRWVLEEQIALATAGKKLTVYEPVLGHVRLARHGARMTVDLRGAKILT